MLKVLVVDDEPLMRKGIISKIDWEGLGLECAGEARDGLEALEQINCLRPDIVIMDIRMPVMDGLECIAKAKQNGCTAHYIMISGYDDFMYARTAMRYGVSHYLLKPVNREELRESLKTIRDQRMERDREREFRRRLLRHYEAGKLAKRQRRLTRLLTADADRAVAAELEEILGGVPNEGMVVHVFRLHPFRLPHLGFGTDDEDLLWYGICNVIEQTLREAGQKGVVFRHAFRGDEAVVITPGSSRPERYVFAHWAHGVLEAMRRYFRLQASAGTGMAAASVPQLHTSYEQALTAARAEVLHGPGKWYPFTQFANGADQTRGDCGGNRRTVAFQEQVLSVLLQGRDENRVRQWIERRFEELAADPGAGFVQFENLAMHMYSLLSEHAEQSGCAALTERGSFASGLLSCTTWKEAANTLFETARSIMRASGAKPVTGVDIVDDVKNYVARHCHENITLAWVAKRYYVHPNYFSRLFKEKSGENFNDYVTRVRLEQAMKLMADPRLKVAEIARMVGYDSAAYFSNVFRKEFGVSPVKYRAVRLAQPMQNMKK